MTWWQHVIFGWHSRIPLCCIAEWVVRHGIGQTHLGVRADRIGGSRVKQALYVPCTPCCIAIRSQLQNAAHIHRCSPTRARCRVVHQRVLRRTLYGEHSSCLQGEA